MRRSVTAEQEGELKLLHESSLCTKISAVHWERCLVYHKLLQTSIVHWVCCFVYQPLLNDSRVYLGLYCTLFQELLHDSIICRKHCLYQKLPHNSVLYFEHFIICYERLQGSVVYRVDCALNRKEMNGCTVHLEYLIGCQVLMHTRVCGNLLLCHELLIISVLCLKH